jgi:hypothetical protein
MDRSEDWGQGRAYARSFLGDLREQVGDWAIERWGRRPRCGILVDLQTTLERLEVSNSSTEDRRQVGELMVCLLELCHRTGIDPEGEAFRAFQDMQREIVARKEGA